MPVHIGLGVQQAISLFKNASKPGSTSANTIMSSIKCQILSKIKYSTFSVSLNPMHVLSLVEPESKNLFDLSDVAYYAGLTQFESVMEKKLFVFSR